MSTVARPDLLLFGRVADLLDPPPDPYFADAGAFIEDCFEHDDGPTFYQLEAARRLSERKRLAVRGPHGLGKTALAAWIVLWFAVTRERAGLDWKVVTTASVWRQLEKYLWPEIRKWARKLKGAGFIGGKELFQLMLKLKFGEAFAVASDEPSAIEGAHADHILYVIDEAKAVPEDSWNAIEGAFSGAGPDTPREAYALAISTPGPPAGRFYAIHSRKAGTEDWDAMHVTLDDAIAAKRISRSWAEQRARQWGPQSSVYLNRVLGEFSADDADGVIPSLAWVEEAQERWKERFEAAEAGDQLGPLTALGVDVARSGADKTVLAHRYGMVVARIEEHAGLATTEVTGRVLGALRAAKAGVAVVDVIGIGAGVVDQLAEQGVAVQGFNASERSELVDRSGELGFTNKRAAAWWTLRELLDPANGYGLELPPDDMLTGDLLAPRWRMMAGGRIQIEHKEDIKKRIGRSPDYGDAVAMAFALEPDLGYDEGDVVTYDAQVQISPF